MSFFVSELVQFLAVFDKRYPALSASQKKLLDKYRRIYEKRDKAHPVRPVFLQSEDVSILPEE